MYMLDFVDLFLNSQIKVFVLDAKIELQVGFNQKKKTKIIWSIAIEIDHKIRILPFGNRENIRKLQKKKKKLNHVMLNKAI